jgi:hypothetical protein
MSGLVEAFNRSYIADRVGPGLRWRGRRLGFEIRTYEISFTLRFVPMLSFWNWED